MSNIAIFKLRDSNVLIGRIEDRTPDMGWLLSSVAVIRRWGTSAGLPELCGGPTDTTICDKAVKMPSGSLAEIPRGQVLLVLPVEEAKWEAVFGT